jgi:2,3-bisphosphoglycerate-dependent phosphoglycerate mutase
VWFHQGLVLRAWGLAFDFLIFRLAFFHSKLHQVGNQLAGGPGLPTQPIPSTVYGMNGPAACAICRIADSKRHTVDLYLVRHAQSRNNAQPTELRVEDPALTDLGHEQARRLAERVTRLGLTKLFTSPFRRALQTAEHVRLATGLVPEVRIDLHEKGGCVSGVAPPLLVGRPGMTRDEILDEFPGYYVEANIDGEGWWRSQPYESPQQAHQRAARLLARTRAEFAASDQRVAYVTHGDFELLFLGGFHPLPLAMVCNASLTGVHMTPDTIQLVDFNSMEHLANHMLSW